jgi:hypothetical protein
MRLRGQQISGRYQPEVILPKWQQFLTGLTSKGGVEAVPVPDISVIDETRVRAADLLPPHAAKAA